MNDVDKVLRKRICQCATMFMLFSSDTEIDNEDDRQDIFALLFLELFFLFITTQKKRKKLLDVFLPTVEDEANSFLFSLSFCIPSQKKTTVRIEKIMFSILKQTIPRRRRRRSIKHFYSHNWLCLDRTREMHQEEHKHCNHLPVIFKLNMPFVFSINQIPVYVGIHGRK